MNLLYREVQEYPGKNAVKFCHPLGIEPSTLGRRGQTLRLNQLGYPDLRKILFLFET